MDTSTVNTILDVHNAGSITMSNGGSTRSNDLPYLAMSLNSGATCDESYVFSDTLSAMTYGELPMSGFDEEVEEIFCNHGTKNTGVRPDSEGLPACPVPNASRAGTGTGEITRRGDFFGSEIEFVIPVAVNIDALPNADGGMLGS